MSYTPPEIARKLRVKQQVVLAWIHRGELEAINVAEKGSSRPRWRIEAESFERFKEKRRPKPAVKRRSRRLIATPTQTFKRFF